MIGFPQTVYPTNRCKWPQLKEKKEKNKKEKTTKKRTNNKGKETKEETPEEKAEREKHELETKAKKQRLQKAKKAGSVIINWSTQYVFKSGFFQQVLPIPKWSRDERPLTRPLKNAKIRTTWMINGKKCLDLGLRILFKAPAWLLISTGDKRYNPITHGTSSQAWQYARSIHQGPEGGGRLDCGQTDGFAGSFGSEQGLFWGLCVVDSLLGPISYLKLWYVQSQLYIFIRVFWIKVSGGWGSMTCMRWKVNAEMGLTQTADLNKEILELLFLKIPIEENFNMFCGYPILTPMYIPFEWYWRRAKLLILTRPSLKHAMRMTLLKGKSQNWPSEPAVIRATPYVKWLLDLDVWKIMTCRWNKKWTIYPFWLGKYMQQKPQSLCEWGAANGDNFWDLCVVWST